MILPIDKEENLKSLQVHFAKKKVAPAPRKDKRNQKNSTQTEKSKIKITSENKDAKNRFFKKK